jgi:hypothetical protein
MISIEIVDLLIFQAMKVLLIAVEMADKVCH